MRNIFILLLWTLLVAVGAFFAGHWFASVDVPANSVDAGFNHPAQINKPDAEPVPVTPAITALEPAMQAHAGARNYRSDYQQLQALVVLAATHPQVALEQSQALRGAMKAQAQAAILDVWATHNAFAAWAWLQTNQPNNNAQFIKLLAVVGRSEPAIAIGFAEQFVGAHRELRKDIYQSLLTGMAQAGAYNSALQLLSGLDIEADTKAELNRMVVSAWAIYEPQAALQWLEAQPEEFKAATLNGLGDALSEADPQVMVTFAAAQTGTVRESLLLPAFKQWLETDPAEAAAWLSAMPLQKDFDPIISEMATSPSLLQGQVGEALKWAGRIQDQELRLNAVTSILSVFKQQDPQAAAAYLRSLSYLTESERTRLSENLVLNR